MTEEQKNAVDHAQKILRAVKLYDLAAALESRVLAESKPLTDAEYLALLHAAEPALQNFERAAGAITRPTPDDAFVRGLKVAREFALYEATHGPNGHALSSIDAAIDAAMQADKETK